MRLRVLVGGVVVTGLAALHMSCLCGPCEIATANKELALAAFEAVAEGNMEALDDLIAVDYVRHCQATPDAEVNSLAAFKDYLLSDRESIPDPELKVVHLIAEDNLVAFWASYSGVQEGPMGPFPATGNRMELDFAGIHRIEDGKIAETWVTWDNLTALTQLGLWPPNEPEELEIVD
jgi:steroid delta-isomerase-like uncharacterized protein